MDLLVMEKNPNDFGFRIDSKTFKRLQSLVSRGTEFRLKKSWLPLQKILSTEIRGDIDGSKEFLEWFREMKLGENKV